MSHQCANFLCVCFAVDADNTGFISRKNLFDILGEECSPELVEKIMIDGDLNKDGKITYQEFLLSFRENTSIMARSMSLLGDENEETNFDSVTDRKLLGLDDEIPGGKHSFDLK